MTLGQSLLHVQSCPDLGETHSESSSPTPSGRYSVMIAVGSSTQAMPEVWHHTDPLPMQAREASYIGKMDTPTWSAPPKTMNGHPINTVPAGKKLSSGIFAP
jgi:hypothetical protein